jgi:hypothetical protein
MGLHTLLLGFLLYFLLPVWLLAGIADYLCHRRTAIERTSGLGEAALHVSEAIEVGIPLLAGLFLEIDALVLLLMLAGVLAHTLTAIWDGMYSVPRRYVSPLEQHIHSHLEYVPIVAVSVVTLLHWGQFAALFGSGHEAASFALQWKKHPIPPGYLWVVLVPVFFVQGVLLLEETFRCWRSAENAETAQ